MSSVLVLPFPLSCCPALSSFFLFHLRYSQNLSLFHLKCYSNCTHFLGFSGFVHICSCCSCILILGYMSLFPLLFGLVLGCDNTVTGSGLLLLPAHPAPVQNRLGGFHGMSVNLFTGEGTGHELCLHWGQAAGKCTRAVTIFSPATLLPYCGVRAVRGPGSCKLHPHWLLLRPPAGSVVVHM